MSKILVIDDETLIRDFIYTLFEKEGLSVITAARGAQAIQMIATEKPDLAIMDLSVPGESGLSLLQKIREKSPKLPVVVFSGSVTPEIEKDAYAAGAIEVIQKGVPVSELRDKIKKIIESSHKILGSSEVKRKEEKILVVDDEDGIRSLLITFFTRKGFKTTGARSGEEALRLLDTEKPTVILLDINMPGMDGLLTLKKIREKDARVGIVMATGVQDEQIVQEAMDLGAYHYVLKPFDLQYLELVVLTRLMLAS